MGELYEKLGDFAAAETSLRAALSDQAASAAALGRLALLLRGSLPDADCDAIEAHLAADPPEDPTRASLLFGLAGVWDARDASPKPPPVPRGQCPLACSARATQAGVQPGRARSLD